MCFQYILIKSSQLCFVSFPVFVCITRPNTAAHHSSIPKRRPAAGFPHPPASRPIFTQRNPTFGFWATNNFFLPASQSSSRHASKTACLRTRVAQRPTPPSHKTRHTHPRVCRSTTANNDSEKANNSNDRMMTE